MTSPWMKPLLPSPNGFRVPYPPLDKLGLIGDRRTAALVSADGDICWMCLPNFDDSTIFGSLLDFQAGGSWKFGPRSARFGSQAYVPDSFVLKTVWNDGASTLELLDCMGFPGDDRIARDASRRLVLRRLLCRSGEFDCHLRCEPRRGFVDPFRVKINGNCTLFENDELQLSLWCSLQLIAHEHFVDASFRLSTGNEVWCAFGPGEEVDRWSALKVRNTICAARRVWRKQSSNLKDYRNRNDQIRRSALLVDLLTFAPTGAVVASPTTSLPARIGGTRNYDYRYTWVRDASLALELHSRVGSTGNAERFIRWLSRLARSSSEMPLKVLYTLGGEPVSAPSDRTQLYGYRGSRPVRFGNGAASSIEMDSLGYLTDCILIYLEHGGQWDPLFWDLIRQVSDFTASNWQRRGAGIWEISPPQDFVVSKVMSWVTLDRALRIADKIGEKTSSAASWERARDEIFDEIMERGWSEQLQAFRQRYGADVLDSSVLLIPIMNFLPPTHSRVNSTIERIKETLDINGWLQRFVPTEVPDQGSLALGEEEGAFLMCSFWLARVHAMRDEIEQASAILRRAELVAGPLGLFSECVDPRSDSLIGNMPLLFSQAEYAKAAIALNEAEQRISQANAQRQTTLQHP